MPRLHGKVTTTMATPLLLSPLLSLYLFPLCSGLNPMHDPARDKSLDPIEQISALEVEAANHRPVPVEQLSQVLKRHAQSSDIVGRGLQLLPLVAATPMSTVTHFTTLISVLAKMAHMSEATKVFDRMTEEFGIEPNTVTFNA